jgi:hypothetical protein
MLHVLAARQPTAAAALACRRGRALPPAPADAGAGRAADGRPAAHRSATLIQRHVCAIEGDGYTIVEDAIDGDLITALAGICCASSADVRRPAPRRTRI